VRALVVLGALAAAVSPAAADRAPAGAGAGSGAAASSKKDARWQAKHAAAASPSMDRAARVGKPPTPVIGLYNTWTREWVVVDRAATTLPPETADRLLRCHFTNEPADMDDRLPGLLLAAARHFGADRVNVVSGFRAPKYNLVLRKKGRRVARDSEHTRGHAVDFWLPGVPVKTLHAWAMKHQVGGIGLYLSDGFVHMDVGRKRTWTDP
jgi:uncharacterized protein YcbK (DUF882 family)